MGVEYVVVLRLCLTQKPHPHPSPPLEGEGDRFRPFLPLKGRMNKSDILLVSIQESSGWKIACFAK